MSDRQADLRRWIEGRRAAERREHEERRNASLPPSEAFDRALGLLAFASELHGWPPPIDERARREDLEMYALWARLRVVMAGE